MKIFNVILLTVVLLVLTYFLFFIGVRTLLRQHFSESYPHVQGTVLSSQVTITHGSKGLIHYHVHISYRYTVDGTEYTGYRYRYDGHPSDSASAYAIVNNHPPDSAVDVYYNPADATDCLLSPGVDAQDVAINFIIAAIILFLFFAVLSSAQRTDLPWGGRKATGGVKVMTEMMVTRLRLPRYPPLPVTLIATAILMIVAAAAVGLGLLSTSPWASGEWALIIVILGGAAVFTWQYLDVRSGKRDLVIDEGARTVQLPLTYGRSEQTPVSFSQIRSILLNKIKHQRKGGAFYTYMVTLDMADASQEKLIDLNQTRAESLGTWLRQKLGVVERASEPVEGEPL
jgi:hypothetical protein